MKTTRLFLRLTCVMGFATTFIFPAQAQDASVNSSSTLAERLGYDPSEKLLIIHADDLGVAHSVNEASTEAFAHGFVNSGSIMVPCPWFPEIAAHVRDNPGLDVGLHLTLTSEWEHYRWGTVQPRDQVPTLLDSLGFMYSTAEAAVQHMDARDAESEIRAQVERAIAFGIQPTHLDAHMGTLFQTAELFEAYLRLGREYEIPVFVPGDALRAQAPQLMAMLQPDDIVIDHVVMALPGVPADEWDTYYARLIENLEPGVTQLIVHIAYDDAEMRAVTIDHPDYGAAWRQRDLDTVTAPAFQRLLEQNDVRLITWREIGALLRE